MESQYKPIFTPRGQACYNHYHIDGETAFIDAILHDKQDVAKVFS